MFKHILVPTDGSPLSARAIKRAVQLAKEQKARVTGFYVGPTWSPNVHGDSILTGYVTPAQHSAGVRKTADHYLQPLRRAAAAAGVPCRCIHTEGDYPYEKIVKAADQNRCDLIVMASHGRRGISRLLLGSETSKVLAHSKAPVLVCR
ncbi:MAG TPA: universal stress protein [Burkholderiales bacterium]|nr:universal stress protein [Burkholderiales bacterium]